MLIKTKYILLLGGLILMIAQCGKEIDQGDRIVANDYKTENVIVVVVDGPRFTETWGSPNHELIPNLYNHLSTKGVVNQEFYNLGNTHTIPGHTTIATGIYEDLDNNGRQYPSYPSFLQHYLKLTRKAPNKAWIVGSKKKLEVLSNCSSIEWRNSFLPSYDTEDRMDYETFGRVKEIIQEHHPNLLFINLKGPDWYGHHNNWELYKEAISQTDSMVNELYQIIETDSVYKGTTTLIMTNDHGRHLDGLGAGFVNHGDKCLGCTHINFFAVGPDFKVGELIDKKREQVDIVPTITHLLGFEMNQCNGNVMTELFKNP